MVRPSSVSCFLFYLTLIVLQVTKTSATCKKTCEKCVGKEYCVVKKAPDCIEGNIDCSDPCLDLDIRSSECFETSIPNGKTCDKSCDFCVKQYRCNIAMNDLGICSEDTFDCIEWEDCLDGEAKKLCAGVRNNGNCHDDCNTCVGSDNCAVSKSNQCSNEKIDCFAKCLNNDVRQAICFNSSIPDGKNCDEECNFCLDQFECNDRLNNASTCRGKTIDCIKNGNCITKKVLNSCGMERSIGQCHDCGDSCFTKIDCKVQDARNRLYGLCDGEFINCDGQCIAKEIRDTQCKTFGFCTLASSASTWKKAQCFIIAIAAIFAAVAVCLCVTCCTSSSKK